MEAQTEKEKTQWVKASKLFEQGKVKDLAKNLVLYKPEDAANILNALEGERAAEILAAVPTDKYLQYAEAFRKAGP
jgi:flagellar motility protein MotE (MotC chaperone)